MTLMQWQKQNQARNKQVFPTSFDLFNDLFDTVVNTDNRRATVPAVNISENAEGFKLQLAVPGMAKEDFKIAIDQDVLTISASHKEEKAENTDRYTRKEFSYNSFSRSFTLPENVNQEGILASYENGIMNIVLPKMQQTKATPKEVVVR